MKALPFWFIFLGTLFAIVGMGWGTQMSISQDHLLAPAHAHNNLIGYVTMVIYGVYYALVPSASTGRLAMIHFWVAVIGAVSFGPGIAMAILGQGEIVVQISTLFVFAGMVLFSWTVWVNRAAMPGS